MQSNLYACFGVTRLKKPEAESFNEFCRKEILGMWIPSHGVHESPGSQLQGPLSFSQTAAGAYSGSHCQARFLHLPGNQLGTLVLTSLSASVTMSNFPARRASQSPWLAQSPPVLDQPLKQTSDCAPTFPNPPPPKEGCIQFNQRVLEVVTWLWSGEVSSYNTNLSVEGAPVL